MDSLPSVSPTRYCSIQGSRTGPGTLTTNISGSGGAPPVNSIFFLARLRITGHDAVTASYAQGVFIIDGLSITRVATEFLVSATGAITVQDGGADLVFSPPIPFMPSDNAHAPTVTVTALSGAFAAGLAIQVTGSGFWTNNPPSELGNPTGIL